MGGGGDEERRWRDEETQGAAQTKTCIGAYDAHAQTHAHTHVTPCQA